MKILLHVSNVLNADLELDLILFKLNYRKNRLLILLLLFNGVSSNYYILLFEKSHSDCYYSSKYHIFYAIYFAKKKYER